jgi:hypothetical protein
MDSFVREQQPRDSGLSMSIGYFFGDFSATDPLITVTREKARRSFRKDASALAFAVIGALRQADVIKVANGALQ